VATAIAIAVFLAMMLIANM